MFAAALRTLVVVFLTGAAHSAAAQQRYEVPFVPTPDEVVASMLQLAGVGPNDFLVDLGSGDGRIVVAAARDFGAQGIGVDKNPQRIREARANAAEAKVTDRVRFIEGDLFDAEIAQATVVTMYLLPEVNLAMRPRILEELRPGTRVVSHDFDMGDWRPDRRIKVPDEGSDVYLWIVPARVAGTWALDAGDGGEPWRLEIDQTYQQLSGVARRGNEQFRLDGGTVTGEQVVFALPDGRRFVGQIAADAREMRGSVDGAEVAGGDWQAVRSPS